MPPANTNAAVEQLRFDIRRARKDIAMLTGIFGLDTQEMTLETMVVLLERLYYQPHVLEEFIAHQYSL